MSSWNVFSEYVLFILTSISISPINFASLHSSLGYHLPWESALNFHQRSARINKYVLSAIMHDIILKMMFDERNHCVESVQLRSFFWSVFYQIRTVQMRESADQKKLRIWTLFTQWNNSGTTGSIMQKLTRIQTGYAECLSRKFVFEAFHTFK